MKSLMIISFALLASLFFLMALCMKSSEAQPPFIPPGNQPPQTQLKGACRIYPSITFSAEQAKELANLEHAFLEEAKPLWVEMRELRLELRFAVSDPQAQPQALLDKQRRMSAIQAKFESLRLSYLIKARAIFTKEQLEQLPPECPLKMGTGYGIGRGLGRGLQKGIR